MRGCKTKVGEEDSQGWKEKLKWRILALRQLIYLCHAIAQHVSLVRAEISTPTSKNVPKKNRSNQ